MVSFSYLCGRTIRPSILVYEKIIFLAALAAIYVGYHYFSSFGKEVSYPFGRGLSYTSFAYSKPSVKMTADGLTQP